MAFGHHFGRRWSLVGRLWSFFGRLLVDFGRLLVDFGRLWTPLGTLGRPCAVKARTNSENLEIFGSLNRPESSPKAKQVRQDTISKKNTKLFRKEASEINFLSECDHEKHAFDMVFTM